MKRSTSKTADSALFWMTFVMHLSCVILSADRCNLHAFLGWSCATLWLWLHNEEEKTNEKLKDLISKIVEAEERNGSDS